MIPSDSNAEFVAAMEEVLDIYEQPYNPNVPVLCMDEQPVQLVKEVRTPIDATPDHPKRMDYEYERAGTASLFLFAEPLAGWRSVTARDRRTKIDWATEVMSESVASGPNHIVTNQAYPGARATNLSGGVGCERSLCW